MIRMEPLFEVQGVMDENRYMRFYRLHISATPTKKLMLILSVVMFVIGFLSLWLELFFSAMVMILAGILLLFWPKLTAKKYASQMDLTARYMRNKPFTIRFFEDELAEFTPNGEMHIKYEDIFRVVENEEMLLIYISSAQAFVIFKNELTRGTPAAFTAFLRDVKHIPYRFI